MKNTYRDNWRVIAEIAPRRVNLPLADFGFKGLEGNVISTPFEIEIAPRRLGDLGTVSMSDSLISDDIDGDYQRRCDELLAELLKRPHVTNGRVTCTETHECSHCHLLWEVLTADEAADYSVNQDEHSVEGEPVCCEKAIAEFRTEHGIPALAEQVTS